VKSCRFGASIVASAVAASLVWVGAPAAADQFRERQWHIKSLNAAEANRISSGQGIVVAVVDTGVFPHRDLRQNLLRGTSVIAGGAKDGRRDPNGHGTEMASLIAAHGRDGHLGVIGIAPAAKILPVVVTNPDGTGNSSSAAEAIKWAVEHGADMVNFSGAVGPSFGMQEAINLAQDKDVLVVAATGNRDQDVVAAYPAAMPGVLAVGPSDRAGRPADFAVSSKTVQICAPGVGIESAYLNDKYWNGDGSSEATAIVSGGAALIRARFPDLSAKEVIHRLTATATDNGPPGRDDKCGYGVLNIVKALTANVPPMETASAGPSASAAPPTSAAAPPQSEKANSRVPAIIGGLVIAALVGGLAAFLLLRRRRSPTTR
jgi:type VII secretion-associated serine protease mycosin